MKFKPAKWYLFGGPKTRSALLLVAFTAIFSISGAYVSTALWAGLISITIGYIVADLTYDIIKSHRPFKTTADILGVYLPSILVGSVLGELSGDFALSSADEFEKLLPSQSLQTRVDFAVVVVTILVMVMLWGRVLMIEADESGQQKKTHKH